MDDTQRLTEILNYFGMSSAEEFTNVYKLQLKLRKLYSDTYSSYCNVIFYDNMHRTYGRNSEISFVKNSDGSLTDDTLQSIKKAVKRKSTQIRLLESMKSEGVEKIREFIAHHFSVDIKLIETADIKWDNPYSYSIAGQPFSYTGTLIDKSLDLTTYWHGSHKQAADMVDTIRAYFNNKTQDLDH